MSTPFYKRRSGILPHLEAGKLSLLDSGVHDFLCLMANQFTDRGNAQPGIWMGSAAAILARAPKGTTERDIRRSLEHLESIRWIKTWKTRGKRGSYPILVSRLEVRNSAGKAFLVNSTSTTSYTSVVLDACRDTAVIPPRSRRDPAVMTESPFPHTPYPLREVLKNPESRTPPTPPTAELEIWEQAAESAAQAWEKRHGEAPAWTPLDYGRIRQLFQDHKRLTLEVWSGRWTNYLGSTEEYGREGHTLKHFLGNFDKFTSGPIGGENGKATRTERTTAALEEGARRLIQAELGAGPPRVAGHLRPASPPAKR